MNRRSNPWLVRLLVLVLVCSIALPLTLSSTSKAHAQSTIVNVLGGLSLLDYCDAHGYDGVTTDGSNTYYSWFCTSGGAAIDTHISMLDACRWQYTGTTNVWDTTDNFYSATGAWCFTGTLLGGINLVLYCSSIGWQDAVLLGSSAYGWSCKLRRINLTTGKVYYLYKPLQQDDMNQACAWMYSSSLVRARFDDFYTPTSWQCFG